MISKSIIVLWSLWMVYAFCKTISVMPVDFDPGAVWTGAVLGSLFMWALVVIPVSLIGQLFKRAPMVAK
jgi:hypothetical protein